MARSRQWELWDRCDCPCGEWHCRWPCCIYGTQASVIAGAENLNGWFVVVSMKVTFVYLDGTTATSLDHSSFENIQVPMVPGNQRYGWGGAVDMYKFGLDLESEDVLCFNEDVAADSFNGTLGVWQRESACVEVELEFKNVASQKGRISLLSPLFSVWWGTNLEARKYLPCLRAYPTSGSWAQWGQACSNVPHYADVASDDTATITYYFGHIERTEEPALDTAEDMRNALCHKCTTLATSEQTHKTIPCVGSKLLTLPSKYLADGDICYTLLPCEQDDTGGTRISDYTVEDSCDDPDCPSCECVDEVTGDWIWTTQTGGVNDSVFWNGDNAIWTDSLGGTCDCGCPGSDVNLGMPSAYDLARINATSHTWTNVTVRGICLRAIGLGQNHPHTSILYGLRWAGYKDGLAFSHIPWMLSWYQPRLTWMVSLRGPSESGQQAITVIGPSYPNIPYCTWHSIHFEIAAINPLFWIDFHLGIDVNGGANYVYGSRYRWLIDESQGDLWPIDEWHWGAIDRFNDGGAIGSYAPPGSLITS